MKYEKLSSSKEKKKYKEIIKICMKIGERFTGNDNKVNVANWEEL